MSRSSTVKLAEELTPEEMSELQTDIQRITKQIAEIVELVRNQNKLTDKITNKLLEHKGSKPYWLISTIAGLSMFLNKKIRGGLVSSFANLMESPLTSEVIKLGAQMLWRQRGPNKKWLGVMLLAAIMCYVCLFGAAFLALSDTLGTMFGWLILGGAHLLIALIALFLAHRST